jgi:hypothetical protein
VTAQLPSWVTADIDLRTPSVARVYDFLLGGVHNFAVDREMGRRLEREVPGTTRAAWANRAFLQRAVRYCASLGIDQHLDIGSGIPTEGNMHEVARKELPGARRRAGRRYHPLPRIRGRGAQALIAHPWPRVAAVRPTRQDADVVEICVAALAMVDAEPEKVLGSIIDYREFRQAILTPHFSGYEVLEGGKGAGSRVRWTLNPGRWTKRRARDWEITAEEVDGTLVEHDARSGTVMRWTVVPAPEGRSAVKLELHLEAPGGLGGMRARSRANKLQHLYGETLLQLHRQFGAEAGQTPSG